MKVYLESNLNITSIQIIILKCFDFPKVYKWEKRENHSPPLGSSGAPACRPGQEVPDHPL